MIHQGNQHQQGMVSVCCGDVKGFFIAQFAAQMQLVIHRKSPVDLTLMEGVNHGTKLGHAHGSGGDVTDRDRITHRCNPRCGQIAIVIRGCYF